MGEKGKEIRRKGGNGAGHRERETDRQRAGGGGRDRAGGGGRHIKMFIYI